MIVGIDLGTTNSLVGVYQDGQIKLIPNAFGEYLTPSVVALDDNDEIIVGKIAKMLAFKVMRPDDRPQFITYAISICICCIMCPIMSLAATILFKDTKTFGTWVQTWAMNFPMALLYQMFYCGPLVRLIFRTIFREKKEKMSDR